jgi:hypothetical protein
MSYTTIDNPELFFQCKLYSGNNSTQTITLDGDENMQPDLVWIKSRNAAQGHSVYDAVRGFTTGTIINTADTGGEATSEGNGLNGITSNGFTLSGNNTVAGGTNGSGTNYVAWCWKAGGSGSSNSDGDITATVSANTTAGFSMVKFNTNGQPTPSATVTCAHGLNAVPKMMILKPLPTTDAWWTFHAGIGNAKYLKLNTNDAEASNSNIWGSTTPTSSVFSLNTFFWGANTNDIIAYCFAEVQGFSKFGSFLGTGNADGAYVHLGFRPARVMIKKTNSSGSVNWYIFDNKRSPVNAVDDFLKADTNDAEGGDGNGYLDFLSNGFKFKTSNIGTESGGTFVYMAFAEAPFVNSNGVPCNAR